MFFATLIAGGRSIVAAVAPDGNRHWPLETLIDAPVRDMVELISHYDRVKARIDGRGPGESLTGTKLAAPLRPPRNIMCVGKNYHAHAEEFARSGFDSVAASSSDAVPSAPIIFTKAPETVIATGEAIRYPTGLSDSVDYEAELAVVIGRGGRGIARDDALDHVFGYTIINDVTARDLQSRHKQWFIGKSLDTFCPMGPWIASADQVDVANLRIRCWINGELRQDANTSQLIFDVPTLIETVSAGLTLQPGDVIATGTPAGVGIGFEPPRYLSRGDRIEIEIDGIGRLYNTVA